VKADAIPDGITPEDAREELERTAVHEAGHAVAAALFRFAAGEVSVRESEERMGFHRIPLPRWSDSPQAIRRLVRRQATDGLLVVLAGPAAERHGWPGTPWDDDAFAGDLGLARRLTLGAGGVPRPMALPPDGPYLRAAMRVAEDLADATWPVVATLATVLVDGPELDARGVRAVVLAALGDGAASLRRDLRGALRPAERAAHRRLLRRYGAVG
jgi:hypothetical protein